ncbi:hypothetical protein C7382_10157 [Porphyromonas loveana]|uniref:Uncharacterized protein n=1 Tax=Porphyromonas loveana TaxID=1884669 RepID=A0A2U1FSJ3_9PORP|nr:hypothetical protein C7382_10157 [Porphyromonas loveana]
MLFFVLIDNCLYHLTVANVGADVHSHNRRFIEYFYALIDTHYKDYS